MDVLLDTHALLWASMEPERLSQRAMDVLARRTGTNLLSIATCWELAIKVSTGKHSLSIPVDDFLARSQAAFNLTLLPITLPHVIAVASLPMHHRDPFDRMLVAQSQAEQLPIVTNDPVVARYGVAVIW